MGICQCYPKFFNFKKRITQQSAKPDLKIIDQVAKNTTLPLHADVLLPVLSHSNPARITRRPLPRVTYSKEIVTLKNAREKDKDVSTHTYVTGSQQNRNKPSLHGKSPDVERFYRTQSDMTTKGLKLARAENTPSILTPGQLEYLSPGRVHYATVAKGSRFRGLDGQLSSSRQLIKKSDNTAYNSSHSLTEFAMYGGGHISDASAPKRELSNKVLTRVSSTTGSLKKLRIPLFASRIMDDMYQDDRQSQRLLSPERPKSTFSEVSAKARPMIDSVDHNGHQHMPVSISKSDPLQSNVRQSQYATKLACETQSKSQGRHSQAAVKQQPLYHPQPLNYNSGTESNTFPVKIETGTHALAIATTHSRATLSESEIIADQNIRGQTDTLTRKGATTPSNQPMNFSSLSSKLQNQRSVYHKNSFIDIQQPISPKNYLSRAPDTNNLNSMEGISEKYSAENNDESFDNSQPLNDFFSGKLGRNVGDDSSIRKKKSNNPLQVFTDCQGASIEDIISPQLFAEPSEKTGSSDGESQVIDLYFKRSKEPNTG